MIRLFASLIVAVVSLSAQAQAPRRSLPSAGEAIQLENSLKANPNDRAARAELLNYYFLNKQLDPAVAIPARRRHILWIIRNAPEDPVAGGPPATIDPAGHKLADPIGFKQASAAWREQADRPDLSAKAMANAAYFFKLHDKELATDLLERALRLQPGDPELSSFLGAEYAMALMGVTMINQNGYPLGADPRQAESAFSQKARQALDASTNAYEVAQAGYTLSFQGTILRYSGKLAFDTAPLAESLLQRAVRLEPNNKGIADLLEQHRQMQAQVRSQARNAQ